MKKKMYKLIASLAIATTLFTQVNVVSNAEELSTSISAEYEAESTEIVVEDTEFENIESEDITIEDDDATAIIVEDAAEMEECADEFSVEDIISTETEASEQEISYEECGDIEFEDEVIILDAEPDEVEVPEDGNIEVYSDYFSPEDNTTTYTDGDSVFVEEEQLVEANIANIYLVTKQKYKLANYFLQVPTVGYKVSSPDGAKASITKKGIITVKKAGTIIVTPLIKDGKKKVEEPRYSLTIHVVDPVFNDSLLQAYYIGQAINMWNPCTNVMTIYNYPTQTDVKYEVKAVNLYSKVAQSGSNLIAKKPCTLTVKYTFYNDQYDKSKFKGGACTYTRKLKIKIAKLNVPKETSVKTNKTKTISLSNIPEGNTIKWTITKVSGDTATIVKADKLAPNKIAVTGVAPGVVTVKATVGTQSYMTTLKVK